MGRKRSVSQFSSYTRCGYAYYLERVVKVPAKQAAWLAQGVAVHEACEYWERTYRVHDVETAQGWFTTAWERELERMKRVEPDVEKWLRGGRKSGVNDVNDRYHKGLEQVAKYIEGCQNSDFKVWEFAPDEPAAEVEFEIDLDGVTVVGKIDTILEAPDGRLLIQDIKTGNRLPIGITQFATYKVAIEEMFGVSIDWAYYWLCKDGRLSQPYDLRPYTREWVAEKYRRLDEAEKRGLYLANPGDHCGICPVRDYCDEVQPYPKKLDERTIAVAAEYRTVANMNEEA